MNNTRQLVSLPSPRFAGEVSVEEALLKRRSARAYTNVPLSLSEISQLLWAAQGITSMEGGRRTAPSAGALYPIEVYLLSGNVSELPAGIYHYEPLGHSLVMVAASDKRKALSGAALMQEAFDNIAAIIVIGADYRRTARKYFTRAKRYVQMEAGHIAQNIYLQAVCLNIGTVVMGAFVDGLVKRVIKFPRNVAPLYLMPIGKI